MIRGMYTAAAGMLVQLVRQQVVAANLANVNTVGFKRDAFMLRQGGEAAIPSDFASLVALTPPPGARPGIVGHIGTGVLIDPVVPIFSQGELSPTGRMLDVALVGDGFFVLEEPDGRQVLTRAGDFDRDAEGRLIGSGGRLVLDVNGEPIQIGLAPRTDVTISPQGVVLVGGVEVAQLAIVSVRGDIVGRKEGENLFEPAPGATFEFAEATPVLQGHLELSNVNPTEAMIEMTALLRAYEANQRMIQLQDQVLDRTVNDVGRI